MTGRHADEGKIVHIERVNMSVNGNPNYRVHLDNGNVYRTSSDSSVVYEIDNAAFRGVTVRLLLTKAQRIWDVSVI